MPDEHGILEVEMVDHSGEIIRVSIHVVTG
jgi:hypothetical protein